MWKVFLILLLLLISSFASQFELIKDDGSFEGSLQTTLDTGIGQHFDMPVNYNLANAKIWVSAPTSSLTVYVYKWTPVPIDLLGTSSKPNPVAAWNLVNLSGISVPAPQPTQLLIAVRNSGYVGKDEDDPLFGYWVVTYDPGMTWFDLWDISNVGIRLLGSGCFPAVEATSLGNIKANFH
jgi:hypothetical protein